MAAVPPVDPLGAPGAPLAPPIPKGPAVVPKVPKGVIIIPKGPVLPGKPVGPVGPPPGPKIPPKAHKAKAPKFKAAKGKPAAKIPPKPAMIKAKGKAKAPPMVKFPPPGPAPPPGPGPPPPMIVAPHPAMVKAAGKAAVKAAKAAGKAALAAKMGGKAAVKAKAKAMVKAKMAVKAAAMVKAMGKMPPMVKAKMPGVGKAPAAPDLGAVFAKMAAQAKFAAFAKMAIPFMMGAGMAGHLGDPVDVNDKKINPDVTARQRVLERANISEVEGDLLNTRLHQVLPPKCDEQTGETCAKCSVMGGITTLVALRAVEKFRDVPTFKDTTRQELDCLRAMHNTAREEMNTRDKIAAADIEGKCEEISSALSSTFYQEIDASKLAGVRKVLDKPVYGFSFPENVATTANKKDRAPWMRQDDILRALMAVEVVAISDYDKLKKEIQNMNENQKHNPVLRALFATISNYFHSHNTHIDGSFVKYFDRVFVNNSTKEKAADDKKEEEEKKEKEQKEKEKARLAAKGYGKKGDGKWGNSDKQGNGGQKGFSQERWKSSYKQTSYAENEQAAADEPAGSSGAGWKPPPPPPPKAAAAKSGGKTHGAKGYW